MKTLMRVIVPGFGIALLLMVLGIANQVHGETEGAKEAPVAKAQARPTIENQQVKDIVQTISHKDRDIRFRAASQLVSLPGEVENELRGKLMEPGFWENREAEGSTTAALWVIGRWRFEKYAPMLAQHIDFELDVTTFPSGISITPLAPYSAAAALAKIGGKETRQAVLQKLEVAEKEKERRLCVWVIQQSEGKEWADVVLNAAVQKAPNEAAKNNLQAALQLLRTEKFLLPPSIVIPQKQG